MNDAAQLKDTLRLSLIAQLEEQRQTALSAADSAHHDATHEQSVAETQYDTIGLEAAYLAHGQSQRVHECELAILQLKTLQWQDVEDEGDVDIGSLVKLSSGAWYWLLPIAGGLKVDASTMGKITVVTPHSPLGEQLNGAYCEEMLENGKTIVEVL
ncbi:hypothetical protein [Thaumasiovibrio subtropicus]|uniref:hypothetical protein n=1 Tax=Thaumasiovibrio subtropicus TaxID=1891207 RepID=UPI000B3606D7|nr:hypothetical protein [Thaumasiovibrio subtropicus]